MMWIQQNTNRFEHQEQIDALCLPLGIEWGVWDLSSVDDEVCRKASRDTAYGRQVIEAVGQSLQAVKEKNGYLTEDIVSLSPETPNLEAILAKFDKPHHHVDDEVRLILWGGGIFGVIPPDSDPFEIHMEKGDFIVIPAYTRHWFTLDTQGHVTALRIFKTSAGWEAIYASELEASSKL